MDKVEIRKRFIEIVAHNMDVKDQQSNFSAVNMIDHERWKLRYAKAEGSADTLVLNVFKNEVDYFVAQLMSAIEPPQQGSE